MERFTKIFFLIIMFFFFGEERSHAQNHKSAGRSEKKDSLTALLEKAKEDTNKVNVLNDLGHELINSASYDSALQISQKAFELSGTLNFKSGSFNACKNIGIVYECKGNFPDAVNYHLKALKVAEELGDVKKIAACYNNIGLVYVKQGDLKKALEQYLKSLQINMAAGDKRGIAMSHNNIGIVYYRQGNLSQALEEYNSSLKLREEIGDKYGMASNYNNIGGIYYFQKEYDKALEQYLKSLKIKKELGLKQGVVSSTNNIGALYTKLKKYGEAQKYLNEGLSMALSIGSRDDVEAGYYDLSVLDSALGNYEKAFDHYKLFVAYRDSLLNEENTKKTIQSQMQYDFDKRSATDSIKNAEAKKVEEIKHQHEISKQKTFTYGGIVGFLVMIIVAGISYNAFRNKKKTNIEIQRQKVIVEEKQKEILDSIYYARRIQQALITSEKYIEKNLNKLNTL